MVTPRVREVLAVDFDGVIHAYSRGWQGGEIYDELVPGTREALRSLSKRYALICFTARHDLAAVSDYLKRHRIEHLFDGVTNRKPAAVAYLDDRAVRFQAWPQAIGELL